VGKRTAEELALKLWGKKDAVAFSAWVLQRTIASLMEKASVAREGEKLGGKEDAITSIPTRKGRSLSMLYGKSKKKKSSDSVGVGGRGDADSIEECYGETLFCGRPRE